MVFLGSKGLTNSQIKELSLESKEKKEMERKLREKRRRVEIYLLTFRGPRCQTEK